jgi:signal peptidase I
MVRVTGESMLPTLVGGDLVLVRRAPLTALRRGQVAVVSMVGVVDGPAGRSTVTATGKDAGWIVKRVAAVPGDPVPAELRLAHPVQAPDPRVPLDRVVLLGDNPAGSFDSRQLGYFEGNRLIGVVVRRVVSLPPGRAQPSG